MSTSSPTYERRGDDLVVQVTVSYPTAALGGSVEVPTPDGPVSLKIPAGSEDGKLIRIKGRGAPKLSGSGKGDVLARVHIEVPKRVNKKERELLEELKKDERLMAKHDDLLDQGPREAPEPETAEEKSKKLGLKTAGGGVAAGGFALAKIGVLGKIFIWLFAWRGVADAWRIGGWIGIVVVAAAISVVLVLRSRRAS